VIGAFSTIDGAVALVTSKRGHDANASRKDVQGRCDEFRRDGADRCRCCEGVESSQRPPAGRLAEVRLGHGWCADCPRGWSPNDPGETHLSGEGGAAKALWRVSHAAIRQVGATLQLLPIES
jgi:hypothetical protein